MENIFYPLRFTPIYQTYIWGGTKLRESLGRTDAPPSETCAESWEISDRDDGMGAIANGRWRGMTFRELMVAFGDEVMGRPWDTDPRRDRDRFPLLIKVLDAAKTLSVQVHPNDATAKQYGGEAKTEMWYVLEAEADAVVYCGLKEGVTPEAFRAAIDDNRLEEWMKTIPVKGGDAIFVPGGRVHAIGAGCLLLEVQQNSNTTYRIYDWGRVGHDGKPRELHIDRALEVTLWDDPESALTPPEPRPPLGEIPREQVMKSPYFLLEKLTVRGAVTLPASPESFQVLFAIDGDVTVSANGEDVKVPRGSSVLLPAAMGEAHLVPEKGPAGNAVNLMRITEPRVETP